MNPPTFQMFLKLLSRRFSIASVIAIPLVALLGFTSVSRAGEIQFNRDIRPILSDKCFQCHGPDAKKREADLRLDEREPAIADLGGYAAIVPGKPEDSEVFLRVTAPDQDDIMPPPEAKKTLSEKEIALLKQWIADGAEYQAHWSFLPLSDAAPPKVDGAEHPGWEKNGIDAFVLRRLEAEGLSPSPEAPREMLIRRLYLDLLGLLPPPEAVMSFVSDTRPEAYETLVDDLLDNPHYGERWGRHWLDQARYADSHGYTIDGDRVMWPYRDWVIRAVNDDLPFDRFTIEQLAGDLLSNPTKAQLVATGFHRNTLINQEGGTDDEQFRNEEVVDRVNTTGAVWLGLTVGCAQCHSHKFDHITQQEFYELFAFFNSGEDVNNAGPTVEVSENELFLRDPDPAQMRALETAQKNLTRLEKSAATRRQAWEKTLLQTSPEVSTPEWEPLEARKFTSSGGAELRKLEDGSLLAGRGAGTEIYTVIFQAKPIETRGLRLRVIPHDSLPKQGPGLAGNGNFILTGFEVWQGERRIPVVAAQADHSQPDYPISLAIDSNARSGWAINVGRDTPKGVKMNAEHQAEFVLGEAVAAGQPLTVVLRHEGNGNFYNIGRFALEASATPPSTDQMANLLTIAKLPEKERSEAQKKEIEAAFEGADVERKTARSEVSRLRKELGLGSPVSAMVMRDLEEPRVTYLHSRGNFLTLDKELGPLQPGVPAVLPPLEESQNDQPATRLDLAQWLVRADQPLTPRVTVNRVWMRYFGKGLVETENDFGTQGSLPSHPELLDWLSRQFVERGWSMKKLHTLIVMSATYRQDSRHRADLAEADPLNHLLARQNRIRFDAEIVRDAALSASALLTPKIGGPSVRPPQPEGVYAFTQNKKKWDADTDDNRFRRAMYTRFYRSAPYPMLTTFDSPDFQNTCTRRARSNTPLQSLTMANDEALFEMAQGLGARLMREVPGTDSTANRERISRAFLLCYARPPAEPELETVAAFQEQQADSFRAAPDAAQAVAPGPDKAPKGFDPATAASWTAVARALMNTDEFITRE